ncbi:MAG: HNH endonuclease [Syntrophorhabdaceae bacterium]
MHRGFVKFWNGDIQVKYHYYNCDRCNDNIEEAWPHWSNDNNTVHYCWDCAFKMGFLSSEEYCKVAQYCLKNPIAGLNPDTGEIEVIDKKRGKFSWLKTPKAMRRSLKYIGWRNRVFERDNYTCQHCNQRGGELNAHHIEPYAKNKKLRFELSNGITLCETCHRTEHKRLRAESKQLQEVTNG